MMLGVAAFHQNLWFFPPFVRSGGIKVERKTEKLNWILKNEFTYTMEDEFSYL